MSWCTRCGSTLTPDADGRCPACAAAPPDDELPTVDEMYGSDPDFTGGVESSEYVRSLWRRSDDDSEG